MDPFDPSTFSGQVPLFPLPNVVLFPSTFLPLHIFEPRYRAMTRAALDGERLIGMALLKPGWESDYNGNPPIHEVVGLGQIVQEAELPDGRFNIMLLGVARARLVKVVSDEPFRTGEVEILRGDESAVAEAEAKREALVAACRRFLTPIVKVDNLGAGLPLSILCDLLASIAVGDPQEKQRLLETLDVAQRCDRILGMLGGPPRPYPKPSLN